MAKTKAKPKAKTSQKTSKPAKTALKSAKAAKPAKSVASKSKNDAAQKAKAAKPMPAAAKPKVESKKGKPSKKDLKGKKEKEELDLFDDGEVGESEELLEYEKDLELSEEDEQEAEELETDTVSDSDLEDSEETTPATPENEEDIYLTDAEGNRYCRAKDCDQIATVDSYCRYHYLALWKRIQIRKEILQDGKLEKYVDDLTSRYPDKFLEMLRKDLRTQKDFMAAIAELEIDESAGEGEFEEDAQTYIDEVRGLSEGAGATMEDDEF